MKEGRFYFLSDEYYKRFENSGLLGNKHLGDGKRHGRPCYYLFLDKKTGLYWMIPISSKIDKYEAIYQKNIDRYGRCDFILFGDVLGHRAVFLIQNMCPVSDRYISEEYLDRYNMPVGVETELQNRIQSQSKKVLALVRKGVKLVFSDVLMIEEALLADR